MTSPPLLISTLAEYQTVFWQAVGLRLAQLGQRAAFLSFDDRSSEMLAAQGLAVHPANAMPPPPDAELDATLQRFGVTRLNHWLSHERFAFGACDSLRQQRKLCAALLAADAACQAESAHGRPVLVQELGGFLSVVGAFFAARQHGIDHWFIEPSFFRGRLFFLRNAFAALQIPDDHTGPTPEPVRRYLEETLASGSIVIPEKDRHQYTSAWKKIVNLRNARRLVEKLVDKHVHGKRQEFGHIGSHVATHARMLASSQRLRRRYTSMDDAGRFIYYPLHVPGDVALTLRTPHLLDQLALIDLLCRSVPATHRVAIKEHPAMVGAVDAARLCRLLERYDNLRLLNPGTNNFEVLRRADAVVSINSKSGAEGVLLGKPVLVLGDAFYRPCPLVQTLERLQDLPQTIERLLASPSPAANDGTAAQRYFCAVWQRTLPGELYSPGADNVSRFCDSLLRTVAAR